MHLSLRAGRLLFKDVRYHSSSQTIKIVKGQISWRYWIRAPTLAEDLHAHAGCEAADGMSSSSSSPLRPHLTSPLNLDIRGVRQAGVALR